MNAEQQYIDLFLAYREVINRGCAEGLNNPRQQAFDCFRETGFPRFKSEDYQQTDCQALFGEDFGMNLNKLNIPARPQEVFRCDVPNLTTRQYFMVNDLFHSGGHETRVETQGVFSGSMNVFAQQHPDIFAKYYNRLVPQTDGLSNFNTAFVQDGYVLYIPAGMILEKPLQLINMLTGSVDTLVNRRILIIVEDEAQAKLLVCDHTTDLERHFLVDQVCEIFVGKSAVFDLYELEESSEQTIRMQSVYVSQQTGSNVMLDSISLTNGYTRNNYSVALEGEHAELKLYGMAILDGKQVVDNHTLIEHKVPHCHSDELFKYVLDDASVGVFSGRIIVDKDAQKTQAYQNNRNLCTSPACRMYAKPQLEIYADDVKCSHGLTTGQLDDNALFYMRSRGIREEEARMLLKFAFMDDVIEGIRLDTLKDRLKRLVEKRFRGELANCKGCQVKN